MKKNTETKTHKQIKRKLIGIVDSNKMQHTVVVKVTTKKRHPLYPKVIKIWKKYIAETQGKEFNIGDKVTIQESRALSKTKRWIVIAKA